MGDEKCLPRARDCNRGPFQSWGVKECVHQPPDIGCQGMCRFLERAIPRILLSLRRVQSVLAVCILTLMAPSGNPRQCCTSSPWPIGGVLPLGRHHWLAVRGHWQEKLQSGVDIAFSTHLAVANVSAPPLSHTGKTGEKKMATASETQALLRPLPSKSYGRGRKRSFPGTAVSKRQFEAQRSLQLRFYRFAMKH